MDMNDLGAMSGFKTIAHFVATLIRRRAVDPVTRFAVDHGS